MKQENSLDANIRELINVQREQMRILSEMNSRDSTEKNQNMMSVNNETARITNTAQVQQPVQSGSIPNMYMYASENGVNQGPTNYGQPQMPVMGFEKMSQDRKQQFGEYAQAVGSSPGNYGFVSSVLPRNSRVSNETRTLTSLDAGYRLGQAGIAGLGALGTAGGTWAAGQAMVGGGLAGFLGSMAVTGGIGAGIGMYADASIDEMKQQSAYRKYLTQNSYMFINPQESVNDRDVSGFSQNQTKQAASFLRGLSSETYLKDEEIMTLTQKFTEGGLLKDTKDLETFKKQMTALTKNVKTGALILNETYENVTNVLSEFKKLGLDQKDFNATLSGIKINASNLGMDSTELTQQVANYLANLNYGTGNSNTTAYSRLEDVTLYTSEMYNKLNEKPDYKRTQQEKASFNMIKNLGGVDKASEYLNTMQEKIIDSDVIKNQIAGYFFDYDDTKKNWSLNQGKFEDFLSSDKTYGEIANEVSAKFGRLSESGNGAAVNEFITNGGTYMRNSMSDGDVAKLIQGSINSLLRDSNYGGNGYDTTKILSDMFKVTDSGAQNLLGNYLDFRVGSGDGLGYTFNQQKKWTEVVNTTKAQTPSIGEMVSSGFDKFKKGITQGAVGIGDWFADQSIAVSDWWYRTRNGVSAPNLSENFKINSLKYGSSSEGIYMEQRDALEKISGTKDSLDRLSSKGYNLDEEITKLTENALNAFNKTFTQSRERVYNWGQVDEGVASRKDEIVNLSSNTGLSEIILAALVKYDQNNQTDKVKGSDLKVLAESLSNAVNKYRGNETLGLLQSYTGVDVDSLLKNQFGINVNNLSKEDISKLENIEIDDIELSDETKKIIKDLLKVDLSKGGTDSQGNATQTNTGAYGVDYSTTGTTQKNEELIKLASKRHGFSEATFAALLATENETGENHGVNSAGARGATQLTSSVSGWAGQVQDLTSDRVWDGNMDNVTGEQNNSMNVAVGAAHFNSYLEKAQGNSFIGYGMYNGGPTGFGSILRSAGYDESQWSDMTGNEILNILKTYTPGTEYEKAMERFIEKLKEVTGDENVANVSGKEINSPGSSDSSVDAQGNKYVINNGIRTYTDTVFVDTTKTAEENAKAREKEQGIVTSQTGQARFNFLKEVKGVTEAENTNYRSVLANLTKNDGLGSYQYAEYMAGMVNKGYSYNEITATDEYEKLKAKALKKGGENTQDILSQVDSNIKAWTTYGGSDYSEDKEYASEELRASAKKRYENSKTYQNRYVIQKYGESVGIDISDFNGDLGQYNATLNETAKSFVKGNMTQLKDFLSYKNGSAKTESATMFETLSATDKLALLTSTNTVNNALGGDLTGHDNIINELNGLVEGSYDLSKEKDKVIAEKEKRIKEIDKQVKELAGKTATGKASNEDIYNLLNEKNAIKDELKDNSTIEAEIKSNKLGEALLSNRDKELMQYLHKDAKGNVFYDSTIKAEQEMTIKDLSVWQEQGEKKVNYGKAKTLLESENGMILGDLSFDTAITKAKEMYDSTKLKYEETSSSAAAALTQVKDTNLQAELSKFYQSNDLSGMKDFLAQAKNGKITSADGTVMDVSGNKDAINQLSSALEKLQDSADITEIMNLITGLQDLKKSLEDTATSARMTYESLDEGTKHGATTGITEDIRALFKDLAQNEENKTGADKNGVYAELLEAMKNMTPENIQEAIMQGLQSGDGIKIGNTTFALNQDTMIELGSIVSKNMDEAIRQTLSNDTSYGDDSGGIDNLTSGREKEIAKAMNISVDELKEELSKLAELNSDLATRQDTQTEEYKNLETDRNKTVEEIFKGYSDSMKDYSDSAKTATESFSSAMEKYDTELAKAISVLESRIDKGFAKQSAFEGIVEGFKSLISPWSGGSSSSNGGTVR